MTLTRALERSGSSPIATVGVVCEHAGVAQVSVRPRLERSRSDRVIGGVAAGVAQHLGIEPLIVRVAFVVLTLAAGFGLVTYLLLWLLAPAEADSGATAPRRRILAMPSPRQAMGGVLVLVGVVLLLVVSGFWFGDSAAWPVSLAAIGFAILWARSGEEGRGRWSLEGVMTGQTSLPRVAIGSLLIVVAMAVVLANNYSLSAAGPMLVAAAVAIGGVALLAGPWAWNVGRELIEERSQRVRTEARAEMAAHLHDSVLQTLALIQRAPESREMVSLARTQERELRAWLYGRVPSLPGTQMRDAVDAMAGKVEREQHVKVEAVVVGDAQLDEHGEALVAALGEATLNAAKHSGATEVSVYVEIEPDAITAYVRDHGTGFDPMAVAPDRRGIADSIIGRMERHGGTATITSRPGAGTEVALRLPRRVA